MSKTSRPNYIDTGSIFVDGLISQGIDLGIAILIWKLLDYLHTNINFTWGV